MAFVNPNTPNAADFLTFVRDQGVPVPALPDTSAYLGYALTGAVGLVLPLPAWCSVPGVLYSLAVYNCGTHLLFTMAPDQQGQTYFAKARSREGFALISPSTGLVAATSDQGTSTTLASPDWAKQLTIAQLDFAKTPWGRSYLQWQASYGSSIVGLT